MRKGVKNEPLTARFYTCISFWYKYLSEIIPLPLKQLPLNLVCEIYRMSVKHVLQQTDRIMTQKLMTLVKTLRSNTKNEKVGNPHIVNQQLESAQKYSIRQTGQYKRSAKRCKKRGYNERQLAKVVDILAGGGQLPLKLLKHPLGGMYKGCWECHISDNWLLVWKQDDVRRVIILVNVGTHSELFDKNRR